MRGLICVLALAIAACGQQAKQEEAPPAQAASTTTIDPAQRPTWENARAAGVDFRAVGQEPGWLLDIYRQDHIVLQYDYGEHTAQFSLPQPSAPQEGATRYDASSGEHTLAVTIRRFPCQDAMSGQAYPSTVEVVIDGRTLRGCGKSV